jgi:hypothetical protein
MKDIFLSGRIQVCETFPSQYNYDPADYWKIEGVPFQEQLAYSLDSPDPSLPAEFYKLAQEWYRDTRKLSVADQIVMHPAYQQIIGMGKEALPYIYKELERTRGHWLWALRMIYRKDYAKPDQRFSEAVDSWIRAGKSEGYL